MLLRLKLQNMFKILKINIVNMFSLKRNQTSAANSLYECQMHCPCFSLLLSTIARINSQWRSIASAVLLGLVSTNQWSELFAGFCIGWVTCLEGKLKFALQDATTPLLSYVWPSLALTIRLCPPVLPAVLSALATEEIQAKDFKCGYESIKGNLFIRAVTNPYPFKTWSAERTYPQNNDLSWIKKMGNRFSHSQGFL